MEEGKEQEKLSQNCRKHSIDEPEIVKYQSRKRQILNADSCAQMNTIQSRNTDHLNLDFNLMNDCDSTNHLTVDNANCCVQSNNRISNLLPLEQTRTRTNSLNRKRMRYKLFDQNIVQKHNRLRFKKLVRNKSLSNEVLEQKRHLANSQERKRMLKLNEALDRLRQLMQSRTSELNLSNDIRNLESSRDSLNQESNLHSPSSGSSEHSSNSSSNCKPKKLSKIVTLTSAIQYIRDLQSCLN